MNPTHLDSWQALAKLANQADELRLIDLVKDEHRLESLQHELAGCFFDFSKQRVNSPVLETLLQLADQCDLQQKIQHMLCGEPINRSEARAVLHTALRGGAQVDNTIEQEIETTQQRMRDVARRLNSAQWLGTSGKPITDVVHIGIGGSHLGPELVVSALHEHRCSPLNIHFVANIDANDLHSTLAGLNPETTLFIIVSKSFSTLETKVNALSARSWFLERTGAVDDLDKHFLGITSNIQAAVEFGLSEQTLLPMWDWVGGRFSLWSAVGLPILIALGEQQYDEFLSGAQQVDEHFANSPPAQNIPVLSALFGIWNFNFLGASSLVTLSYDERLDLLPDYLQQLEMESNGKSVDQENNPVDYPTMPVLWGGVGTKGQHAYHQQLHQGTHEFAADFIVVAQDDRNNEEHHTWLLANALGQSQAMAIGHDGDGASYRRVRGNHPSTTITFDRLAPAQLGALLSVYEHKVFCLGVLWNINSFDQWGVELGKNLAVPIQQALAQDGSTDAQTEQDAATQSLINYLTRTH